MTPYYDDGQGIVVYHGDCREILPHLPKVDLVLTDPPYGIGEARGKNKSRINRTNATLPKDYGVSAWDDVPPADWLLSQIRDMSRWQIIFGGNYFTLPPSSCWLVWDKDNTGDFADCELAWTNFDKAVRRLKWRWNGFLQQDMAHKEFRDHPTQKPLPVIRWALSQAPDDCLSVLDPFMGSGTTLVAALSMGKRCVGIEREEKYCAVAVERLRQSSLFGDPAHRMTDAELAVLGEQDHCREMALEIPMQSRELFGEDTPDIPGLSGGVR